MIPNDPNMLLSFINMKLRDFYTSLDSLCEDLDINKEEIEEKLNKNGYFYDERKNCFKNK